MAGEVDNRWKVKQKQFEEGINLKKDNEIEIYYSENEPPCKVIRTNEPNLELMAKAFRELYYETRGEKKDNEKDD